MALEPNQRLGPYEILSAIGAGGMGEVYRARDTRLERIVAVKILPDHLSDRAALRERFEREARTIGWLVYRSDESGPNEIYVQPYPGPGGKWQISTYQSLLEISTPNYDVSPDGQRFLMVKPVEQAQAAPTQINVVLNWFEELKRRVPIGK